MSKFTSIYSELVPIADSVCHCDCLWVHHIGVLAFPSIKSDSLVSSLSNHVPSGLKYHKLVMLSLLLIIILAQDFFFFNAELS